MARVVLHPGYFLTGRRAPADVRRAVAAVLRDLANLPLPLPGDTPHLFAPVARGWRHRIGATPWCLFYLVADDVVTVRALTVPVE